MVDEVDLTMDASVDHRMITMTMHVDVCMKEQKRNRREAAVNSMMLNDPSAKTAFQGGRVTELFKKGCPLNCDDYKGILLASHLAKLVLHQFLKPIKPVYDARIPVVQMGVVSKRGTYFGTHMLTRFIESRTYGNDSIGICFVDLVKAFDRVLRELVMGWPRPMTSHPIEYLRKVGVGSDDAIWIVNWITKRRPLVEEWGGAPQNCGIGQQSARWLLVGVR